MHQVQRFQKLDYIVGDIDFPPVETMARRHGVAVVVVVKAVAEIDYAQHVAVTTIVAGVEALPSRKMQQRVRGEAQLPDDHCAHEKAPYHHLPGAGAQLRKMGRELGADHGQDRHYEQCRDEVEGIEEPQLRITGQVRHPIVFDEQDVR